MKYLILPIIRLLLRIMLTVTVSAVYIVYFLLVLIWDLDYQVSKENMICKVKSYKIWYIFQHKNKQKIREYLSKQTITAFAEIHWKTEYHYIWGYEPINLNSKDDE